MMATYNGEEFLREQLDSILCQTVSTWKLLIRDDNSSDQTRAIIKEYEEKDSRIKLIKNTSQHHGAYYNFFGLLNDVRQNENPFDFYMFADQDDIWDVNKLECLISYYYEKVKTEEPVLIYADMRIIDANGKMIANSMDQLMGIRYTNPISAFMSHKVYGCNTLFNRELFEILPLLPYDAPELAFLSHDNFTTKTAALKGQVYFYNEPTMGYRRYGHNVTNKHEYNFAFKRILKRISKIDELAKDHALTYKQTLVATNLLRQQTSIDTELLFLDKVEKIINKGGLNAVKMVWKEKIDWGNRVKTISRSLVLSSKLYKKYL
ncbi:glycosyltransferase [Streptococcus mitis]|uniref:Glycosyltransferase n=2 Tax=Streptococcus mitis TaxID=28037 RepID=A0A6L5H1K3_STRMT|nr:glycosyltransferase family 2 protein [Streptococcus mitis]MQP60530.1 glycosyltransferase [Streptococcus mitis]MQP69929.1 glycosyltransferase [Streptococcus mitis]MQP70828.1 glycosyltransferase [Streptococcus mitis]MQP87601.1 glycosyltransferase [Streptococcus mitis]MQP92897.1 glycosyltransferase [Streptococcus mitis]